jgi:hypothetical protein
MWAVGLFEGEGHIGLHAYRTGVNATRGSMARALVLASTDEDVVRRFHGIVGVGHVRLMKRQHESWKPCWRWQCGKWSEIEWLLGQFLPHLGERRRAKARELLACPPEFANGWKKTHCKRGHPLTGDNVYEYDYGSKHFRICKACRTARRTEIKEEITC